MFRRSGWFEGFSTATRVFRPGRSTRVPATTVHPLDRRTDPVDPDASAAAGFALAKRGLDFIRPHRWRITVIVATALLLAAVTAAEPLVMKRLFDSLGSSDPLPAFLGSLATLVVLEIARASVNGWLSVRTWEVRIAVEYGIRERLVTRLGDLPISFHRQERVGGLTTRLNQGTTGVTAAFAELAFQTLPNLAYLTMSVLAMARLEPRLLLVVAVFAPLPALVGAWAAREQTARERRLLQQWTRVFARFHEVLSGMLTVKGFAMERAERDRFLSGVREGHAIVRGGLRRDARTDVLRGMAATLARLTALGVGGWLIVRGQITIGTLVAFLGYISGLFGPVQGLTNTYQTMRKGAVALETVFGVLDAEDRCADLPDAIAPERISGAVTFERVGFRYAAEDPAVLEGIDLDVKAGEMIALVGPSGSGKSTMMSLLQRLEVPTAGRICVDGLDLRALQQDALRRQIGVVFQDVHLFADTVAANIAYGRPDATMQEIERAAVAANAHAFITTLPDGYATEVGERGSRLSGGQRQRIAIARALLKDPAILVLDEATSALDTESEFLVQEAIHSLAEHRTTFIIAHRLSTVVAADRIVVLRDGRIEAVGTHEELMQREGYYADAVRLRSETGVLGVAA